MASSNTATRNARDRLRQVTSARLEEEKKRLERNESDLLSFFTASEEIDKTDTVTDEKIAALRARATEKKSAAFTKQAAALAGLRERGETVASIAELTGLSETVVRAHIKRAQKTAAPAESSTDS